MSQVVIENPIITHVAQGFLRVRPATTVKSDEGIERDEIADGRWTRWYLGAIARTKTKEVLAAEIGLPRVGHESCIGGVAGSEGTRHRGAPGLHDGGR